MCNQSLGLLGAAEIVLDGTSVNHGYCETFFEKSRDEILVCHPWNWARKRAYAIQTTDPLFGPDNAFTIPSDCLRALTIEEDPLAKWNREGSLIITNEGNAAQDYSDDSVDYLAREYLSSDDSGSDLTYLINTAFTSSSETSDLATYCTSQGDDYEILKVEYIYQVTDVSSYPAYMDQCLVMNLAIKLCSPIIQGAATNVMTNLQSSLFGGPKVYGYLAMARSTDAQEAGGEIITTNKFLDSRR